MRYFMIFILAGYAVRCEDEGYYLVQVPLNLTKESRRQFNVYWNVPTKQCTSKQIPFKNLYERFGIIQNQGDRFRGEEVSILYDPGDFPAIFESNGENKYRNGGVPQNGSFDRHIVIFRRHVEESIPDKDFAGVGIIDFESWRPIFRQNFGVLKPYKTVSIDLVRKKHPFWPQFWMEERAKDDFESAAREFMQRTLQVAKEMRPKAVWGYYGFPYCFNSNGSSQCVKEMNEENERISWLWWDSTALFPSVYSSSSLSTQQLTSLIRGRVKEALRVKKQGPILPYFWYRYREGGFLKESDLEAAIKTMYQLNTSGFIIWGSSADVNTAEKCKNLLNYVENIFGPAIAKYTKSDLTKITVNLDQSTNHPLEAAFNKRINNKFIFRDILKNIVLSKYNVNENDDDESNLISNETTPSAKDSTYSILSENMIGNITITPRPGDKTSTSEPSTQIVSEKVTESIEPLTTETSIDPSETQLPRFDITTETAETSTETPKSDLNMNYKTENVDIDDKNEHVNINYTEIFNELRITSTSERITQIASEKATETIEPVSTTETSISEVWENNLDPSKSPLPTFDITTETPESSTETPKSDLNMNDKTGDVEIDDINEYDNINYTNILNENLDYIVNEATTTEKESQPFTEKSIEFSSSTAVEKDDSTTVVSKDVESIYLPVNANRIKCLNVMLLKFPICFETDTGNIVQQLGAEITTDFPSTTGDNNKHEEELYIQPLKESNKIKKVTSASTTVPKHYTLDILFNVILIVRMCNY